MPKPRLPPSVFDFDGTHIIQALSWSSRAKNIETKYLLHTQNYERAANPFPSLPSSSRDHPPSPCPHHLLLSSSAPPCPPLSPSLSLSLSHYLFISLSLSQSLSITLFLSLYHPLTHSFMHTPPPFTLPPEGEHWVKTQEGESAQRGGSACLPPQALGRAACGKLCAS